MARTIWGVEGGDLKRRWQTHLAVGGDVGFYFTFAVRAFEHWARIRLYAHKPFFYIGFGSMWGKLWTLERVYPRMWEFPRAFRQ